MIMARGFYHPDWVLVQATPEGEVNWIVETKGRVWEGTTAKDEAIEHWCARVSVATGMAWRYVRVDQTRFDSLKPLSFAQLVHAAEPLGFVT
jgi:type III restriction enzyme